MGTSTFKQLISSGLLTLKAVFVVYGLMNSVCFAETKQGAIASAHPLATNAGLAILASGGNEKRKDLKSPPIENLQSINQNKWITTTNTK